MSAVTARNPDHRLLAVITLKIHTLIKNPHTAIIRNNLCSSVGTFCLKTMRIISGNESL